MSGKGRFGYEWSIYSDIYPEHEKQFLNWIYPIDSNDFIDKDILDAGCGMGKNSYYSLKYGAKTVTSFDADKGSVKSALKNLLQFDNSKILLMDIYDFDQKNKYDIVFSIGVIHHLEHPKLALKNLIHALKPGGTAIFWVYSLEGNEWIKKYISPVRKKFLSRLPLSFLHTITYFVTIPFYLMIKTIRPINPYIEQISKFSFSHVRQIIFDQFLPVIANYWSKEEVLSLIEGLELKEVSVHSPPNKMGWTIIGKK